MHYHLVLQYIMSSKTSTSWRWKNCNIMPGTNPHLVEVEEL